MTRITDHTLDVPAFEGDVTNHQAVGVSNPLNEVLGGTVSVASPLAVMTRQQALIHAAWLVVCADQSENFEEFRRVLRAVLNT